MRDLGHEETEEVLKKIEKRISAEYRQAEREIAAKLDDYMKRFAEKDKLKLLGVANGQITEEEYKQWRLGQVMIGKRWSEMRDSLAKDFANTSQIARSIAFDHIPEVYAINHDYGTFQVEKGSLVDTSYTLYDRQSIEQLYKNENTFIPAPGRKVKRAINEGKQIAWDKKQVQSVMMQGLLQGESIPNIATRLANSVGEGDRKAAIRNARTLTTGIENAGRVASYDRANAMGIKTKKQWLAALDMRTRHWHASLDGVSVENDKPFTNDYGKIMYPGDPEADPANIYNCRCTLIADIEGFENDLADMSLRHNEKLGDMSYDEWKKGHYDMESDRITKQDEIAETMKRVYGAEYAKYSKIKQSNMQNKDVDKTEKKSIMKVQTKIINKTVINPMPEAKYETIKKALDRNGIIVRQAIGEEEEYLKKYLGAEATYSGGYIMHLGKVPSASALFEEIIHSTQAKIYGELESSDNIELYAREVAANRMLLRNSKAYGFDKNDIDDIQKNLKYWENVFEQKVGEKYENSDYKREIYSSNR